MAIFQHNPLIRARISQPFPPKVIEDGPWGPATPPSQGKGNIFSHNFVSPAFINTLQLRQNENAGRFILETALKLFKK